MNGYSEGLPVTVRGRTHKNRVGRSLICNEYADCLKALRLALVRKESI